MYSVMLHGRRLLQLQNAFFSSASHKSKKLRVSSYLVHSVGLTPKLAESVSKKVCSESNNVNPESVLNLFRSHGFTDSQISTIITDYPKVLLVDAEKSLAPKLQFLQSRGDGFTEILSKVPKILTMEGIRMSDYYGFVKEIIDADKSSKLCYSLPEEGSTSMQADKFRNVSVLRDLGVPQKLLFSLLSSNRGYIIGRDRFDESLKKVVEMGFDPTTSKFVQALLVFRSLSDRAIEKKLNVYKRLGFSVGDVWEMFKRFPTTLKLSENNIFYSVGTFRNLGLTRDEVVFMVKRFPTCLGYSAESVKKKTDFLVKKMNWPVQAVVMNPEVLGCSLDKRIKPRCKIIKALMSRGLLGSQLPSVSSVLKSSNQVFFKKVCEA